jgi:hypothetical protein
VCRYNPPLTKCVLARILLSYAKLLTRPIP